MHSLSVEFLEAIHQKNFVARVGLNQSLTNQKSIIDMKFGYKRGDFEAIKVNLDLTDWNLFFNLLKRRSNVQQAN